MHMIGYFEGIDSERGIAWRCANSFSLRDFLRLSDREKIPDHSWLSRTRSRLPHEAHETMFGWVLRLVAERGLVKGERIGVDGSTMEANAALRTIVRRDSSESYRAMLTRMAQETDHESLSRETVRRRLAENHLKPWQKDMWCIPKVDAEYARMEDALGLYVEQPDPKRPVVCFDESPTQLIGEARQPIPAAPGRPERFDYEYRRNGAVNLFVFLDAHRSWRRVKVTDRRTADDFALCMRELVDVDFPEAERIRVVLDNLSTHTAAALYAGFPPAEARRVLRRLEFHYTPKHASWLNMVEIEIGVLKGQCLDRRIESCDRLVAEIDAWQSQRNQSRAQINWMFSTDKARTKMARAYPDPSLEKS